jgi:hypothetical protein
MGCLADPDGVAACAGEWVGGAAGADDRSDPDQAGIGAAAAAETFDLVQLGRVVLGRLGRTVTATFSAGLAVRLGGLLQREASGHPDVIAVNSAGAAGGTLGVDDSGVAPT